MNHSALFTTPSLPCRNARSNAAMLRRCLENFTLQDVYGFRNVVEHIADELPHAFTAELPLLLLTVPAALLAVGWTDTAYDSMHAFMSALRQKSALRNNIPLVAVDFAKLSHITISQLPKLVRADYVSLPIPQASCAFCLPSTSQRWQNPLWRSAVLSASNFGLRPTVLHSRDCDLRRVYEVTEVQVLFNVAFCNNVEDVTMRTLCNIFGNLVCSAETDRCARKIITRFLLALAPARLPALVLQEIARFTLSEVVDCTDKYFVHRAPEVVASYTFSALRSQKGCE